MGSHSREGLWEQIRHLPIKTHSYSIQGLRSAGGWRRPLRSRKASKDATKNICKGDRKKRPMIRCEQRFDNAKRCLCRANCSVVLSCAVCFCHRCLIGSMGVICVGGKTEGRERSNTMWQEKRGKVVLRTQYALYIPGTYCSVFERKHTAQRHSTATKGTAPHRTAPHGATLRCWAIYSRTDLSWACMWSNSVQYLNVCTNLLLL